MRKLCSPFKALAITYKGVAISSKTHRINERIKSPELRVIGEDGKQLGVMTRAEALSLARQLNVDLVEVAPQASPPVCRLMDFGKFQYERAKREREARKAQKQIDVKEIRLRPKTGEHDIAVGLRRARKFLEDGSKVKVRVRFRGREITHPEVAIELLDRVAQDLGDLAEIEKTAGLEGRSLLMILAPKGTAAKAAASQGERQDED
jgi:translation initiation factor IF-3